MSYAADDFRAIHQALKQIEADKKAQFEKLPVEQEPPQYLFTADYDPSVPFCGFVPEPSWLAENYNIVPIDAAANRAVEQWLGWPIGTVTKI